MINRYKGFLLEMLCESIMITTREFLKMIEDMPSHNKIADDLFEIINKKKDIKTNYNAVGLSDKNDEVSFIPDSQYQRMLSSGQDPWTKTKSKSKIGRMIRQILSDNPGSTTSKYTDAQIEEFVNQFKAAWDKKMSTKREIKVVKGEDIKYWYDEKNYLESGGTLGNSCMRHSSKNKYMQIYASNPDKISLVVLTENDKLIARALLWKIDESEDGIKYYLDRIYVRRDSDYEFVNDWVLENVAKRDDKIFGSYQKGYSSPIKCFIKNADFEYFPYADTFCFLYKKLENGNVVEGSFLSNRYNSALFDRYLCLELQNTDGTTDIKSHRWSEYLGKFVEKSKAVYIDEIEDYIDKEDAVQCEYNGNYYLKTSVVFSKFMNSWIPTSEVVEHPEYGVVMRSALKSIVISHDESKNNFTLFREVDNGDVSSLKFEDRFGEQETFFRPYSIINRSAVYYDKEKYLVYDVYQDEYPSIFCVKSYRVVDSEQVTSDIPHYSTRGGKYIIKEYSDVYNIKIEEDQYVTQYIRNFINDRLDEMFYIRYLRLNDKKHADFFKQLHEIKSRLDNYYLSNYKTIVAISDKVENPELLLFKFISDAVDESLKSESVIESIKSEFAYVKRNYINPPEITKEKEEFIFNTYKILFMNYFFLEGRSSSLDKLYEYINEKHPDKSKMAKELENYIYYSFFDAVYDYARRNFYINIEKFIRDNNVETNVNQFISTFQRIIPFEKVKNLEFKL